MGDVGIMGLRAPGGSWDETKELAIMADDLGYSCVTMGESWGEDAFTSLAQIAAVTERIKIGTSIVPVFARSPANLAMTALNMDVMSKGRFFLGLGASGKLVIEDLHGEKFSKPITRIREYVDILRKAMNGERLDHSGELFKISIKKEAMKKAKKSQKKKRSKEAKKLKKMQTDSVADWTLECNSASDIPSLKKTFASDSVSSIL